MVSPEEVKRIAKLCRLKIEGPQVAKFTGQLNEILGFVEQLQTLPCDGIEPLISVNQMYAQPRTDITNEVADVKELFSNVPGNDAALAKELHCYVIPKVIE